jgi:purine-nucleoside phosphorylase
MSENRMNEKQRPAAEAAEYIAGKIESRPKIGMILGSGLGVLADDIEEPVELDYAAIPGFPQSTVAGHAGKIVCGKLEKTEVMVWSGRFHYYEGYSMDQVVLPVRVMKELGVETLIVTNAAGGINRSLAAGDLMLIRDHIKFIDESPLRGANIEAYGPRFNDMSDAYTRQLRELAKEAAGEAQIDLREGVYAYMTGPSFETPTEIDMLRTLGADAVGMSTVPEVLTAAHAGLRVLGISTISNMAAGILDQPLTHEEVMATGRAVRGTFLRLLRQILRRL